MYHKNTGIEKKKIIDQLRAFGIIIDVNSGQILGYEKQIKELHCHSLYLLRHAETLGTKEKKFMSDTSENAVLTEKGKNDVMRMADIIEKMQFDCVLYSTIARVKQTAEIISQYENYCNCYIEVPWMKGIDNAGWEGKNVIEFNKEEYEDFYQREIVHNVFAKSSKGCSWGEVLLRCIELRTFINENFKEKKILLISQGSIFMGLRIVLGLESGLWNNYKAEDFFGLAGSLSQSYGKLQYVFGEKITV